MATIKVLSNSGVDVIGVVLDTLSMFPIGGFNPQKSTSQSVTYKLEGGYSAKVLGDFNEDGTKGAIEKMVLMQDGVSILQVTEVKKTLQSLNKLTDAGAELFLTTILGEKQTFIGAKGDDIAYGLHGGGFFGGKGNDIFHVTGPAQFDGGTGRDTVYYDLSESRVVVFLADAALNQGEAAADSYVSIENVAGGAGDDLLVGDDGANWLYGGRGSDWLYGGLGADRLVGGAGIDFASYSSILFPKPGTTGVIASLADPTGNTNEAAGDTYVDIEGLAGTSFQDTLVGDDNDNQIIGGLGNDYIKGGLGADTLTGDDGGGVSPDDFDSFVYAGIAEGGDTITDFGAKDFILISKSGFGLASDFTLTAGSTFISAPGAQATTEHWTFLFDTATNKLYFDEDGNGAGSPELLAELVFKGTSGIAVDQLVLI